MHWFPSISFLWVIVSLAEGFVLPEDGHNTYTEDRNSEPKLAFSRQDFDLDQELNKILDFDQELIREIKPIFLKAAAFDCDTCLEILTVIDKDVGNPKFEEGFDSLAVLFCTLHPIFSSRVCEAGVKEWGPQVFFLAKNDYLEPDQACYSVFGPTCANPVDPKANWTLNFPDVPKPAYVAPTSPPSGTEFARVLHLSDIHMDILYEEGSNAHCHDPLCCRGIDGEPISEEWEAGKYGSLAYCDTPLMTFELLLSKLAPEKFDWILVTGDLPGHDVYNQTKEENAYVIGLINDLLWKYFPHTPVLQALGNHGSAPVDQYIPPYMTEDKSVRPMAWLYDMLAEKWLRWLPESTENTVKEGAFWAWEFIPGLKIISINSGYGQSADWYTTANNTDVHGMLQWMIDELQDAESRNLKVWLLSHHPKFTLDYYKQKFDDIIRRYINVIAGWFNGHTHKDELRVIYDPTINGGTPVLTGFVAPSVTTYQDINLGYRIYYVDSKRSNATFRVADYDTYFLNLTDANESGDFNLKFEYNFKSAYNMTSLLPVDFDNLLSRMLQDPSIAQEYRYYFYKSASPQQCDASCAKDVVSSIQMTLSVSETNNDQNKKDYELDPGSDKDDNDSDSDTDDTKSDDNNTDDEFNSSDF